MRRYLGSLVLALLALVSLWFLQQRTDPPEQHDPTTSTAGPTPTMLVQQPADTATPSDLASSSARLSDQPATTVEQHRQQEKALLDQAVVTHPPGDDHRSSAGVDPYLATAEDFAKAFARPDEGVDPQQWWQVASSFMSPRAVEVYSAVDPKNVEYSEVVGPAEAVLADAPAHLLRQVRVPTDSGPYLVSMETAATGIMVIGIAREDHR